MCVESSLELHHCLFSKIEGLTRRVLEGNIRSAQDGWQLEIDLVRFQLEQRRAIAKENADSPDLEATYHLLVFKAAIRPSGQTIRSKVEYIMKQLGFFTVSLPTDLDVLPESVHSDVHSAFVDTWHQLTSLISQVRKCQKLANYYLLQEELGTHIVKADNKVDDSNIAIYQAKKELNKISNTADPEKKRDLHVKLLEADLKRQLYLLIGKQYRTVGDAMAWQLYQYNAHAIHSLGMNQSPGIISQAKGKGALTEESQVHRYWEQESAFALRHDYTNCLRVSDLSIFRDDSNYAELREVKASSKKKKPSQKAIQRRALEFAHDHVTISGNDLIYYPQF